MKAIFFRQVLPWVTLCLAWTAPPAALGAAQVHGEVENGGPAIYIIQLADDPVATYRGGIAGLEATNPSAAGVARLDARSPASIAYDAFLQSQQQHFLAELGEVIGRTPDLRFEYRHALNGVAVVLSPEEAQRVAAMDGVVSLNRDHDEYLLSDAGPNFIGATAVWGGGMTALDHVSALSGTNEVPPNGSTATGVGTFVYNLGNRQLNYSISTSGLTDVTSAHIHFGAAGVNGPIEHPLDHTTNPMVGVVTLTEVQQGLLANRSLYVNIHTSAFPGGEIRGQIEIDGSLGEGMIVGVLDTGINQGHPSFAAAAGDGYVHINPYGVDNYVGHCVANPSFCNSKLIGAWALHPNSANPADTNGHGSHTASTAVGNMRAGAVFTAPTRTHVFPFVSGVAPRANVIAYQVCVPSCPISSTSAAVNQAVIDGVHVLNYSISGGTNPYNDTTAQAFLNASAAGIIVAASAGNAGPNGSTVAHQGPWVMTVAAHTHNREILNVVTDLTSSEGPLPDILGEGPTAAFGPAPLVYAGAAPFNNPLCNPFPAGTFSGQIVVCDRGAIGRVQKGVNVLNAGGGGMILANDAPSAASLNADGHALPAVHITHADGIVLKNWMASGSGHEGAISGGTVDLGGPGNNMASFSSRGPAGAAVPGLANLVKPDVSAPGLNILAAYFSGFTPPPEYNIISGTSMSAPHAAGAAALLRALRPAWTSAEIKSALMTTASAGLRKEDNTTPGDAFDFGAGGVDLRMAPRAGFVLGVTHAEYQAANPATGGDPRLLNLPSMGSALCMDACTWTRTLRSVLPESQAYNATFIGGPDTGGSVSPSSFTLPPGGTQVITVTVDTTSASLGAWIFGRVAIDPVTTATLTSAAASFSGTPALAIPDNQYRGGFGGPTMACHTLDTSALPAGSSVRGVRVELSAAHTFVGDLVIKLGGPDGRILGLMSRPGAAEVADDGGAGGAPFGFPSNLAVNHPVMFRDGGAKDAEQMGGPPLTTSQVVCLDDAACEYFPNPDSVQGLHNLNGFVGGPAVGNWTLCMGDRAGGDIGNFQAWTLHLDYDETLPDVAGARMPIAVRAFQSAVFADGFEN